MNWLERAQLSYLHYRHKVSPVLFLASFVIDLWLIEQPDSIETILFILSYFSLTLVLFLCLAVAANRDMDIEGKKKWSTSIKIFLEIFLQFTFGALASALFVLYFKGADFIASLPFLFILAGFLIGNEFAQKHTSRLEARFISIIFLSYTFLLYIVPLMNGKLGNSSFIISTSASFILSIFILLSIKRISPILFAHTKKVLISSIAILFVGVPALIFLDIIPPLPLMLREGTVAHSVTKVEGVGYTLSTEAIPTYKNLGIPFVSPVYHIEQGGELSFFTAIYTPIQIKTDIIHIWKWYDPEIRDYVERSKIILHVSGGRDDGFRTYSTITDPEPGLWSVTAELGTGQILGHRKFVVKRGSVPIVNINK